MIKIVPNEYLHQLIASLGSMPLHLRDYYNPSFVTSVASMFSLAWNISFDFDILQENLGW